MVEPIEIEIISIEESDQVDGGVQIQLIGEGGPVLLELHAPDRSSAIDCAHLVASKLGWSLPGDSKN